MPGRLTVVDTALLVALVGVAGALAGALTTATVTVLTGWLTRRSEQRRWVLDRRLEAFVDFNQVLARWRQGELPLDEQIPVMHDLLHSSDRLSLVSTLEVADKALLVVRLASETMAAKAGASIERPTLHAWSDATSLLGLLQRRDLMGQKRADRRELDNFLERWEQRHAGARIHAAGTTSSGPNPSSGDPAETQ